jgi:hypothetical protein
MPCFWFEKYHYVCLFKNIYCLKKLCAIIVFLQHRVGRRVGIK